MNSCGMLAGAAAAVLVLSVRASVHAQCARFQVPTIPGPDCQLLWSNSYATGISESGEICGTYGDCDEGGFGAVWLGQGEWIALPVQSPLLGFSPRDINLSLQMAGTTADNPTYTRAAYYDFTKSTLVNLGVFPGDNNSAAHAINDRGVVCGYSYNSVTGPLRALMWNGGLMSPLNLPLGPNSFAYDIAENGAICGWMGDSSESGAHAFIWLNGQTTDLGLVLDGALAAEAWAISRDGQTVVGYAYFDHPHPEIFFQARAFQWHDGAAEYLRPVSPYISSFATGVNDSRIAVGYCDTPGPGDANSVGFVWRNGVMTDLNDMIPSGLNLFIRNAWAINNAGQIIAHARVLDSKGVPTGDQTAVRLTPIAPPPGDCDCNGRIDMDDLLGVINQWGPAVPTTSADFNNDGIVSLDDLVEVLRGWTS